MIALIVIPSVDGIVYIHFVMPWVGSVLHFVLPLHLHRQMREQLANLDMESLASFDKLLQVLGVLCCVRLILLE